jgi:hypothetical protein
MKACHAYYMSHLEFNPACELFSPLRGSFFLVCCSGLSRRNTQMWAKRRRR